MTKKSFQDKAKRIFSVDQDETAQVQVEARGTRAEFEGTRRLKDARLIPIEKIKPDPDQPRKTFPNESLNELAATIKRHGVLQPITVEYEKEEDYFRIVFGERRYQAALRAGLAQMPCVIGTIDSTTRLAQQIIENIHREDLSPVDKARGLLELKKAMGEKVKWVEVEEITGLSPRRRQQLVALLELPEQIQSEIVALGTKRDTNQITEKHARALQALKDSPDKQQELFEKMQNTKEHISGQEAMKIAKAMINEHVKPVQRISFKFITTEDLIKQLEKKLRELKSSLK